MSRVVFFLLLFVASLLVISLAHAEPTNEAEAKTLLVDGSNLFKQERYEDALGKLERSYELVPSPNSALMIARCLVKLDRPVEAYEHFQRAEKEAGARLEEQPRYRPTFEAAKSEGQAVRETLGAVVVRVSDAPAGTVVELQAREQRLERGEATLLGKPGSAEIVVRMPDGKTITRRAELQAGREETLSIILERPKKPSKPPPEDKPLPWQAIAALTAGGVAVVAFGLSIGFGVHGTQIYNRLERECAPRCGPEHGEDIEEGERAGIVANVSLAIGLVGVAASVAFLGWYLAESTEVSIGAGDVTLRSRF
ncbi:MAG TPA: CDC27 family protein [Polyangiaceae bacterium]|nr:CDC27 family protein [Polyangiaceae bacterium]